MEDPAKGCVKCDFRGFLIKKDKKVFCDCRIKGKVARYLRPLGEIQAPGKKVLKKVKGLDTTQNMYFIWDENEDRKIHGLFSVLLVKRGLTRTYHVLDAYELVDIWFRTHALWDSVMKIMMDVLILQVGFTTSPNRETPTLILQCLENRKRKFKTTWVFQKGKVNTYPEVYNYVKENDFIVLDFNMENGGVQSTALK
jgi:hypothetical protein